jgi:hypothetical protein
LSLSSIDLLIQLHGMALPSIDGSFASFKKISNSCVMNDVKRGKKNDRMRERERARREEKKRKQKETKKSKKTFLSLLDAYTIML